MMLHRPLPASRWLVLAVSVWVAWHSGVRAAPGGVVIQGQLLDPERELRQVLGLCETVSLSSELRDRVLRTLDALGYRAQVTARGGQTVLELTPYKLIRRIYIKGNWPLPEEEIQRRLRFRPGQRLPEGPELAQAIARQEERMKRYLSEEGYFEGSIRIKITPADSPDRVNLQVELIKGRRHKIGEVRVRHLRQSGRNSERPISDQEIGRTFHHWYQLGFNTIKMHEDTEELRRRYHELGYPGVRLKTNHELDPRLPPGRAVRLLVDVQPRKRVEVKFTGNHTLSAKELEEALTFRKEAAYDDYEAAQSAKELRRLYQSTGYIQARVRSTRRVGPGTDEITFHIEEGPRFRIREVEFRGNQTFSEDDLRRVIRTRPFPWYGYLGLGEGGYITDTQLSQDVERLESFYREEGFGEVHVGGEVAPDPALIGRPGALAATVGAGEALGGRLHVRFTISEGRRVTVEEVVIHGNKAVASQTILSQLQLKPGRPFTENALKKDKARIAQIYGEQGYPYVQVLPPMTDDSEDGLRTTVQFSVVESRSARFGAVFIRGNFKTRRSVILSDLPFKEGDRFDVRLIESAEANLRQRQIFNLARVQLLGLAEQQEVLPVLITVEERHDDHGAIELGVGGSSDNYLFGSVAYTNQNLFGFGTSIMLKGEVGMRIQSGEIRYRDPRLLGSTVSFGVEGFVRNQLTYRLGEVLSLGTTASVTKELLPRLTAMLRYELRWVTHKEDLYRPPGIDESSRVDVSTRTAGIGPALVYDRRDNPLNPRSGYRLGANLLYASKYLGGGNNFLKLNVNGQALIPLPKDMTLAFAVRYDQGIPLAGEVLLPSVERYYAGGNTTIRGFEEDRAWVERVEVPLSPLSSGTVYRLRPQGGNIRLLTNFEFQFPIWKESLLFGFPIMGAIFMDNGFVANSFDAFDAHQFRHGIGIAPLRLATPAGNLSLEYAWPLDPQVGDPATGRVHFNFGFVF